jgi:hypothetical protein
MEKLGITLMGEVTNVINVIKIIAVNCAHLQQTGTEKCLSDGQV